MKFDEKFKIIMEAYTDDDYDPYRYDDDRYSYDPSNEFVYTWEDLTLITKDVLFAVDMIAYWKYNSRDPGDYYQPPEPAYYEFDGGKGIERVCVYDKQENIIDDFDNTDGIDPANKFKEKYPKDYEMFMKDYFNSEPDKYPEAD